MSDVQVLVMMIGVLLSIVVGSAVMLWCLAQPTESRVYRFKFPILVATAITMGAAMVLVQFAVGLRF